MSYPGGTTDHKPGYIAAGVAIMLIAAMFMIFVDLGVKQVVGIALMFVIGLGLTVAGSSKPEGN